jgi:hypothetical protein
VSCVRGCWLESSKVPPLEGGSAGPDCVRGCWLESTKVPPIEGGSAGPEVVCWVPPVLGFFLGGSCPA